MTTLNKYTLNWENVEQSTDLAIPVGANYTMVDGDLLNLLSRAFKAWNLPYVIVQKNADDQKA